MTQVFALHTGYGLMTAVAAIDAGLVPSGDERVLVPINSAAVPETNRAIHESPQLRTLLSRFDRIEPLNPLLDPLHPTAWAPGDTESPAWERLLSRAWQVDADDLDLFVQTPQVAPTRTLLSVFRNARITVVGDGLMTYAPIRSRLSRSIAGRVQHVLYPDVVPDVVPLLFTEVGAQPVPVPAPAFAAVVAEIDAASAEHDRTEHGAPAALVLGQYLAALGLVSTEDETSMQEEMVDRAVHRGARRIVFKPHPTAPPALADQVRARAAGHGVAFEPYRGDAPAEVLTRRLSAVAVVAGFSTALPTVRALYGTHTEAVGNATVLAALQPYENGNRIPATIVDATNRPGDPYAQPGRLQHLVDAVGYCMQPRIAAHLRERAEELLDGIDPDERARYFAPRRLAELHLPGGSRRLLTRLVIGSGGTGRTEETRLALRGAGRRAQRAWKAVNGR
ncbi:polysialyltransferase family glycosyltransferase [Microbacterium sp. KR10-403]|uniref:polysialyltransferase family glycosyltransferase n=1 Tax=Microbacterium sp. KR10-403 TaxID=3158581 RepID=UPI0032E48889